MKTYKYKGIAINNVQHNGWTGPDVYIGRLRHSSLHFGNPFSHLENVAGTVRVSSRDEAVDNYAKWLEGHAFQDLEPERRKWILMNLHTLEGKALGCWCAPKRCHAEVLIDLIEEEHIHQEIANRDAELAYEEMINSEDMEESS